MAGDTRILPETIDLGGATILGGITTYCFPQMVGGRGKLTHDQAREPRRVVGDHMRNRVFFILGMPQ